MKRVDKSHWKSISSIDYIGVEVNSLGGKIGQNLRMTIIQLKPGKFCCYDPYEPIHDTGADREKRVYMTIEDLLIKPAEVFGIKVFIFSDANELNEWLTYKIE